jgi:hypothetical protein
VEGALMRWFKHMANMLDDPWVQDVFMAEHGVAGYGFLCGIYEIYAKECGTDPGSWITIPLATVTRKLRVSAAKVERMLNDCSTAGKISFEINLRQLRIKIAKMQELRDEWTRKDKPKLRSESGASPEEEAEELTNVSSTDPEAHAEETACPRFDELLKIYPKVREPERCLSIWQSKGLDSLVDKIISTVNALIKSDQWKEQNGRFVPALPKFLEDEPWNDGLMPSNRKSVVTELVQALKAGKPLRGKWEGGRVYRPEEVELVDSGGQYQIRIAGEGDFSLGMFAVNEQEDEH